MFRCLLLLLSLLLPLEAFSATYYIDYVGGSDTANGTTSVTPWKHSPGDANATGEAAAATLTGGDVLLFKGGVVYIGEILPVHSGVSTSSRLIYDGNTAGTYGTDRAIIDCNETYYHAFWLDNVDFITIQGFEIKKTKNVYSSAPTGGTCPDGLAKIDRDGSVICTTYSGSNSIDDLGAIRLDNGNTYITIDNNIIHQTQHWSDRCVPGASLDTDNSTVSPNAPSYQHGISVYDTGNDNIIINNNEIYAAGRFAINVWRGSNIMITNNNIGGGTGAGLEKGYFSVATMITGGVSNVTIADNTIHDGWQYQGDDSEIRCHSGNFIMMFGTDDETLTAASDPHSITIERNFIYSDKAFDYANGSATGQWTDNVYDVVFRNNIVVNPMAKGLSISDCSNVQILGNTFIYPDTAVDNSGQAILFFGNEMGTYIRHGIKNNIFWQDNGNAVVTPIYIDANITPAKIPTIDNNLYYTTNHSNVVRLEATNYTLANWQAYAAANLDNQDANSISGNPLLANIPANWGDSSIGDYRLTINSTTAIDTGIADATLDTDYTTASRSSPPDIGAYEYNPDHQTFRTGTAAIRTGTANFIAR